MKTLASLDAVAGGLFAPTPKVIVTRALWVAPDLFAFARR